jgi:hypothetical protein
MQVILSICIVKILCLTPLDIPYSVFGVLISPVVSVKVIDWCFLAFDDAMACAIPFELTLNYGAIY